MEDGSGVLLVGRLTAIPSYLQRRGLKRFHQEDVTKRVHNDTMCFFRCLSFFLYAQITEAEKLLKVVFPNQTQATFPGLKPEERFKSGRG